VRRQAVSVFEFAPANLPEWRPNKSLVVVDRAAKSRPFLHLLLCVGHRTLQAGEHDTVRSVLQFAREGGEVNRILA
jgi:hypothetical protein